MSPNFLHPGTTREQIDERRERDADRDADRTRSRPPPPKFPARVQPWLAVLGCVVTLCLGAGGALWSTAHAKGDAEASVRNLQAEMTQNHQDHVLLDGRLRSIEAAAARIEATQMGFKEKLDNALSRPPSERVQMMMPPAKGFVP